MSVGPVREDNETPILEPPRNDPEDIPTGIQNMTVGDINQVLWGTGDFPTTGYQEKVRGKDIYTDMGLDPMDYRGRAGEFLLDFEKRYMTIVSGMVLIMYASESGDLDGEGEYMTIPATYRGQPRYQAEKGDRFDALERYLSEEYGGPAYHLTASPRRRDGESTVSMLIRMWGFVNKMMSALDQEMGRRPDYVWAFEMGEEGGIPHIHMIVLDPNLHDEWLTGWWIDNDYGGDAGLSCDRVPESDIEQVVGYLVKYLNKEAQSDYWLPLLRLTGKRSFGWSQDLREKVDPLLVRQDYLKEEEEGGEKVYTALWMMEGRGWDKIRDEFDEGLPPPAQLYDGLNSVAGISLLVNPTKLRRTGSF